MNQSACLWINIALKSQPRKSVGAWRAGLKLILALLCACVSPEQLVISATPTLNGCLSDGIEFYALFFHALQLTASHLRCRWKGASLNLVEKEYQGRCREAATPPHRCLLSSYPNVRGWICKLNLKFPAGPLFCLKRIKLKKKRQLTPHPAVCIIQGQIYCNLSC